jgi:hypothetical protein
MERIMILSPTFSGVIIPTSLPELSSTGSAGQWHSSMVTNPFEAVGGMHGRDVTTHDLNHGRVRFTAADCLNDCISREHTLHGSGMIEHGEIMLRCAKQRLHSVPERGGGGKAHKFGHHRHGDRQSKREKAET